MANLLNISCCIIAILSITVEFSRAGSDFQITKQEAEFEVFTIQFYKNESERISKKLRDERDSLWINAGEIFHIIANNSDVARVNEVMEDSLMKYDSTTPKCHEFYIKSLESFIRTMKQALTQSLTVLLDAMESNLEGLLQDLKHMEDSLVDHLHELRSCESKDPPCKIPSLPVNMTGNPLEFLSNMESLIPELSSRALTLLREKVLPTLLNRGILDHVYDCKEKSDDYYSHFLPVVRDALYSEVEKLLEQDIPDLSSRRLPSSRTKRV